MKAKYLLTLICTTLCCMNIMADAHVAKGVNIQLTVDNYKNSPVVLGYYYNGQMLVKDTVVTNEYGKAELVKDEAFPEGIYVIYFPDKGYFDIMLTDDQTFTLSCDTLPKMVERTKVSGCKPLETFIDYQNYLNDKQRARKELNEKYKTIPSENETERNAIRTEFDKINAEVKASTQTIIDNNKETDKSLCPTILEK